MHVPQVESARKCRFAIKLRVLFHRCIILVLSTFDILPGIVGVWPTQELTDHFSAYVTSFIAGKLVGIDAEAMHRIHGWGQARLPRRIMGQALTNGIWLSETGETHDAG
jgi:hypothetical protein